MMAECFVTIVLACKVQVLLPFSRHQWHCDRGWKSCGPPVQASFATSSGPMAFICWVTVEGSTLFMFYSFILTEH